MSPMMPNPVPLPPEPALNRKQRRAERRKVRRKVRRQVKRKRAA